MNRTAVALLAAALVLAAGGGARAGGQDGGGKALLDAAAQAIENVDFEGARRHAERAVAGGGLTPGQLVRAHRLLGEIAGALDDARAARQHFLHWLLLDSGAALPAGMSPKITEPFAAARAEAERLGRFGLEVRLQRRPGRVVVSVTPRDPLRWIAGVRARLAGREVRVRGGTAELPADDGEAVEVEVVAVDDRGNQLTIDSATAEPRRVDPVDAPRRHRVPAALRWPTWTALSLVAAGSGSYFGWRVGQAQDDLEALNADSMAHTFDEARAIQDRGERAALVANVSLAVAGAAVAAAIVTVILDRQ